MPKFFYEEAMMRELYDEAHEEHPDPEQDFDAVTAHMHKEPDQRLSTYEPAQCSIDKIALEETSRLAMSELCRIGIVQLVIDYDGGYDEGFAHFRTAKLSNGEKTLEELVEELQQGPLGEKFKIYHDPSKLPLLMRVQWTKEALDMTFQELATQLLGKGFGTGEYSLEGTFVADLGDNTLTDIAPGES